MASGSQGPETPFLLTPLIMFKLAILGDQPLVHLVSTDSFRDKLGFAYTTHPISTMAALTMLKGSLPPDASVAVIGCLTSLLSDISVPKTEKNREVYLSRFLFFFLLPSTLWFGSFVFQSGSWLILASRYRVCCWPARGFGWSWSALLFAPGPPIMSRIWFKSRWDSSLGCSVTLFSSHHLTFVFPCSRTLLPFPWESIKQV